MFYQKWLTQKKKAQAIKKKIFFLKKTRSLKAVRDFFLPHKKKLHWLFLFLFSFPEP